MRIVIVATLFFGACWSLPATGADQEPPKRSVLMEKKVEYAQNLLKALMTENFDEADRNVKLMKTFTRLEEMYRGKRPEYKAQLTKFQTSISELTTTVEAKDYDKASDAYVNMIQSCIRCHRELKHE